MQRLEAERKWAVIGGKAPPLVNVEGSERRSPAGRGPPSRTREALCSLNLWFLDLRGPPLGLSRPLRVFGERPMIMWRLTRAEMNGLVSLLPCFPSPPTPISLITSLFLSCSVQNNRSEPRDQPCPDFLSNATSSPPANSAPSVFDTHLRLDLSSTALPRRELRTPHPRHCLLSGLPSAILTPRRFFPTQELVWFCSHTIKLSPPLPETLRELPSWGD